MVVSDDDEAVAFASTITIAHHEDAMVLMNVPVDSDTCGGGSDKDIGNDGRVDGRGQQR